MSDTGELSVAEMLAAVTGGRPGVNHCWVQDSRLSDKAREFIAGLEAAEDEHPQSVYRKGASDFLIDHLGVVGATAGSVSRHLKRDCKCRPKNPQ